jgi:hypothetical protein
MIDTTRIQTGFDVEIQLGGGWFRVALQALAGQNLLLPDPPPPPIPPGAQVEISDVQVVFEPPDRDLRVALTIDGFPLVLLCSLELSEDGTELIVTTDRPGIGTTIPFGVLDDLASPPTLTKVAGEDGVAPAMVVLANLDLQASPQDEEPLPDGEFLLRGDAGLARSFLPSDRDLVVGLGQATFPRFANDIWQTPTESGGLRAEDGSHPFPNQDDPQGKWNDVSVTPRRNCIRTTLHAEVPVDSPLIDVIPDGKITVTIDLRPDIVDGTPTFAMEFDTDIDFGLLGDLLAAFVGGVIGFLIGLAAGGPLIGAGIGIVVGVIVLEVTEAIVSGVVKRKVRASLEGQQPPPPVLSCDNDVVVEATLEDEGGIVLGAIDAIPRSIAIHLDEPDPLHERRILISTTYEELEMNASGLALAGAATPAESFTPLRATLVDQNREDGDGALRSLVYRAEDGTLVELPVDQVFAPMTELAPPLKLVSLPGEADIRLPGEKLGSVCLHPTGIRRKETVVTDIRFSTGLELRVLEAVALQDAGATR